MLLLRPYSRLSSLRPISPWLRLTAIAGIACALMACQSRQVASPAIASAPAVPSPEDIKQQQFKTFVSRFQFILGNRALEANSEGLTGEVRLRIKINRNNEVFSCETQATGIATANAPVADLSKKVCWSAVFPIVPGDRFNKDGNVEVVAPLIYVPMSDIQRLSMEPRYQQYAQGRYFAERTLMKSPPGSIGVVTFEYLANKQGKVKECVVNLERHRERPEAFTYDNVLQSRLTEQCKHLDIAQMPGFSVDETGVSRGAVAFEYSPWMAGPRAR
ncbi:hypothetical protein [Pseudomonas graminis]|uniref:TonB C-terminal domain-containing protein n=1 Tax=Pseudomonas graminis TaxID=158627 RepID=A0A1C2ECR3_9PSED|nr:hypothetical protein [Pseudomonas graminis]OCX24852.1 hypothetical protein BBI10_04350 [Pseudomonas graminis]